MNIAPFHDAHIRPPRGGWTMHFGGSILHAYTEAGLVEQMVKWERNQPNQRPESELRRLMWQNFCEREPERCGGPAPTLSATAEPAGPPEVTKEMQGPPMWTFLNTLAVAWTPGLHGYFVATVDRFSEILVCPFCKAEWRQILSQQHPIALDNRRKVCQWVNDAHNQVNARIGKSQFPYSEMVRKFGAPIQ